MKRLTTPNRLAKYWNKNNRATLIRVALFVGIALWISLLARWEDIYSAQKQIKSKSAQVTKVVAIENTDLFDYPPIKTKRNVRINLLNGTGNTKVDAVIVKALVGSGYTFSNIELGEAKVVEGTGTTITANADYEAIVAHIRNVLQPIIPDIADGVSNSDPNVESGYDVVIITGSKAPMTTLPRQDASR